MKLAANLGWLYAAEPLEKRFAAAARDGFDAAEILLPYDRTPRWYADALAHSGLELVLINTPIGEGMGRLGMAAIPGARDAFRAGFARAIEVAAATRCPAIHIMAGDVTGFDRAACRDTLVQNLAEALPIARAHSIRLSLEALNRSDAPGYFYSVPEQALEFVRHFDSPWLRLQFDFYHCVMEGLDARDEVARAAGWIGHAQIAGAPDRYEPDLASDHLLEALGTLRDTGYDGWIGCEYRPRAAAAAGLGWQAPLRANGWLSR